MEGATGASVLLLLLHCQKMMDLKECGIWGVKRVETGERTNVNKKLYMVQEREGRVPSAHSAPCCRSIVSGDERCLKTLSGNLA